MLVMKRRPSQRIRIGNDIEVVFVGHDGQNAKIGIIAPPDVPILRDDIVIAKPREDRKGKQLSKT